jgi:hypothetical protein
MPSGPRLAGGGKSCLSTSHARRLWSVRCPGRSTADEECRLVTKPTLRVRSMSAARNATAARSLDTAVDPWSPYF